ncbi:MAG TPA: YciI family protein [Ornithinibacter sp.]|nr:YciI family protein [Ornithinibacter sp.]
MPQYAAIIYSRDVDWTAPEQAAEMVEYGEFSQAAEAVIRGGAALYPTSTATTVRVAAKGEAPLTTDGPYAETKEALTGFYLLECADLDEAVRVAATIPGAWDGAVEVRPVIDFGM